ncbi:hypothetical protein JD844_032786 [Phrynosoma platyrhinos]|uniref:Ig-like domain-containing protein n=1 Tax=Phrynosoma platyrhinos TaxID=52577 RepID=A0ABQ7T5E1_PHRPL|nr:hypothetical protein JD844_032786 [Phrynosoma platyrhinos]
MIMTTTEFYAPIFVSNQTIYYSWEGNPINISCDVLSNPSASIHWRRGKLLLPVRNTTHLKTHSVGSKLILEVRIWKHASNLDVLLRKLETDKNVYALSQIAPASDNDFGRYNCTATNRIGTRYQEYILALAGK